jgi:hypothetical protein
VLTARRRTKQNCVAVSIDVEVEHGANAMRAMRLDIGQAAR